MTKLGKKQMLSTLYQQKYKAGHKMELNWKSHRDKKEIFTCIMERKSRQETRC